MILNEKAGDLMGADNQKQLERRETLEAIGKLNLLLKLPTLKMGFAP